MAWARSSRGKAGTSERKGEPGLGPLSREQGQAIRPGVYESRKKTEGAACMREGRGPAGRGLQRGKEKKIADRCGTMPREPGEETGHACGAAHLREKRGRPGQQAWASSGSWLAAARPVAWATGLGSAWYLFGPRFRPRIVLKPRKKKLNKIQK